MVGERLPTLPDQRVDSRRPYTHTRLELYRERPHEAELAEGKARQAERIGRGTLIGLEGSTEDPLRPAERGRPPTKSRAFTSSLSDSCLLTRIEQEPARRSLAETRLAESMVPHQPMPYIPNPKGTEWANAQDHLVKSRKHPTKAPYKGLDLRPFLDEKNPNPFKTSGPFPLSTFVPRPLLY